LALVSCWGCASELDSRRFQARLIRGASADEVFAAAQVILRREFGRLDVDQETRQIVSAPRESQTSSESGTARDLFGGPSTIRRVARLRVSSRPEGALARLRVDIERRDTTRSEVFQPDRYRLSDAPGQTAIERDAATSSRQNAVWTFVRRDRRLERALLAELEEHFAPEPEAAESPPPGKARP